jgi:hypothetical protein
MMMRSPSNAAFPCPPGKGLTRSWARPRAVSRSVSWEVMSAMELEERDVLWVSPDAIASRFLTR